MKSQRCYNGVRLLGSGPCLKNVAKLDAGAMPMVLAMSQRGLQVDLAHFAKMEKVLIEDMDCLTEEVRDMTGVYCNLDSGDQVSDLLFKQLGLKQARPSLTKSGDRESVENEVLVAIQHDHPVVPKILNFKELSKLKGTYVSPMPRLAKHVAFSQWRMYPNFNTTRVPSGRLSCKAPNLLAMPNRTARGREICEGFITDPGWVFLSVDESQIEPRTVAHRSHDPALMRVYFEEEDIYSDFATNAFRLDDARYRDATGWHYPTVDKKTQRFPAKTCILAAIYDVTNVGLLEQMPVVCKVCGREGASHGVRDDRREPCPGFQPLWNEVNCQEILHAFYRTYPGILSMRKRDHARARQHGFIWDDWGRLLHVASVWSVLDWVVSAGLREVGNFPIQSTAQGTVKLTMAAVQDDLTTPGGGYGEVIWPLLQIHDELLFECREDVAEEYGAHVSMRFETCVHLDVPIQASSATSENWGKLQK